MKINFPKLLAAAILLGSIAGTVASASTFDDSQTYCDKVEDTLIERNRINGTLACFEPDVVEVQLPEEIESRTDLRCVCRREHNNQVQLIPLAFSKAVTP